MAGYRSVLPTKYYSSNQIESMIRTGHVARMGDSTGAYRVLVGKAEGKRPLGKPRRRREDNIKMDLQEVGRGHGLG